MGSAVTQVLADVYMYEWEKEILALQKSEGQLYLRFRDDIFLTSTLPYQKLEERLRNFNEKDENIKLTHEIGKTANYLDVTIFAQVPRCRTIVYRKPAAQPYLLPFTSSHPSHIKRNIPYSAYIRAIRICSDASDGVQEFSNIRYRLLLNQYPSKFIDAQVQRLLRDLKLSTLDQLFQNYGKVRKQLFRTDWKQQESNPHRSTRINWETDLLIHFSYIPALECFGTRLRSIWDSVFRETPLTYINPILGYRLTPNLTQILVRKKPPCKILQSK